MKQRSILAVLWLSICLSSSAQTQQGFVKTLGRPSHKGVALSGVSVRVKGGHNAVLSNAQGNFAMPMPGKKPGDAYALQQVQKQGYELRDKAAVGRQYAYSDKVPLTLVMASSSQLISDKQRIENKAYEVAERGYKAKLVQLEQQKDANRITIDQYRQQLQDLQDKYEKYQSLIDGLAEHYALVDYDALDAQEREINICIENGDLERADALLQQLGIQQRAEDIAQRLKAGQRLMDEARQEQAEVLKRQEKDAEYLYQLYTIALAKYDNDKARFYIETRAELDTTNVEWQIQAADYLRNQNESIASLSYYLRALEEYDKKEETDENTAYRAGLYIAIAKIYKTLNFDLQEVERAFFLGVTLYKGLVDRQPTIGYTALYGDALKDVASFLTETSRYKESLEIFQESILPLFELLAKEDSYYISYLAEAQEGAAILHNLMNNIEESEKLYIKSLHNYQILSKKNPQDYLEDIASVLYNLALLYKKKHDTENAEKCFMKALSIRQKLAEKNPQRYHPVLARTLIGLGDLYCDNKRENESEELYKNAIMICRSLYDSGSEESEPLLARALIRTALLYSNMRRFKESETLYQESLNICRDLFEENPAIYLGLLAETLNNYGIVCYYTSRYKESKALYEEALALYRQEAKENSLVPPNNLMNSICNVAIIEMQLGNYSESEKLYKEALMLAKKAEKKNPNVFTPYITTIMADYSGLYLYMQQYTKSEKLIRDAIAKAPTQHWMQSILAMSILFQGRTVEAEHIYNKYKTELRETFLDDFNHIENAGVIPKQYEADVNRIKRILND